MTSSSGFRDVIDIVFPFRLGGQRDSSQMFII